MFKEIIHVEHVHESNDATVRSRTSCKNKSHNSIIRIHTTTTTTTTTTMYHHNNNINSSSSINTDISKITGKKSLQL
jgi:hypothetical protein